MTTTALEVRSPAPIATPHTQRGLLRPIAPPKVMLEVMKETRDMLAQTLEEGVDYGVIPGTDGERGDKAPRKALLKPGAEKITIAFGCVAKYEVESAEIDHDIVRTVRSPWVEAPDPGWDEKKRMKEAGEGRNKKVNGEWQWQVKGEGVEEVVGQYVITIRCRLELADGTVVGEGLGVASSFESRYRGRAHELQNTIVKMAMKRAHVGTVLGTFGLSEAFTQDLDDEVEAAAKAKPVTKGDDIDMPVDPRDAPKAKAKKLVAFEGATKEQGAECKTLLAALGVKHAFAYLTEIVPGAGHTTADCETILVELRKRVAAAAKPTADGGSESTVVPSTTDGTSVPATSTGTTSAPSTTEGVKPAGAPISDEQRVHILNLMDKAGHTDAIARIKVAATIIGRSLPALADLTSDEAVKLIAALKAPPTKEGGA